MLGGKKNFCWVIIFLFFCPARGEVLYEEHFNYPDSEELPSGWFDDHESSNYGPSWSIKENCLYHRHVERGAPEVPAAFYTARTFGLNQPLRITVRLKTMTKTRRYNSVETGILLRAQETQPSKNHYRVCFEFHSGQETPELKISPWSTSSHYSSFHSLSPVGGFNLGEWYTLKVEIKGYKVTCYVNDTFIAGRDLRNDRDDRGRVPPFTYSSGWIGLTTLDGEEAYFDYIKIESLPRLVISSIFPPRGSQRRGVSVIIRGEGFKSGVQVKLTKENEEDIEATLENVSARDIVCIFDLRNAAIGQWDVIVINPDGETAKMENAFTVESLSVFPLQLKVKLTSTYFNPFNLGWLKERERRYMKIYNILGQLVWERKTWNKRNRAILEAPSGVYFYELPEGKGDQVVILK
jgi:hypothetical protein